MDALIQCIISSEDDLSAKEAHDVNFIDKALIREESRHLCEAGGISDAQVQGIEPIKWTFDAH